LNIDNTPALHNNAEVMKIANYISGNHKVKQRKDFVFKDKQYTTAKIILQSIKTVIDFHSSYLCGNPVTLNGEKDKLQALNAIYRKGAYNNVDYLIANNLYTFGNAFEYVYRDTDGVIKSKIIRAQDSFPIYDANGLYTKFVEKWVDTVNNITHSIVYYPKTVQEFVDDTLVNEYRNTTGLPIHYTNGNMDLSGFFGVPLTDDLIPIQDEIEALLSKMSDSVGTLSLNPIGVSSGDRVDANVDTDVSGPILNIESGGTFSWATAQLDTPAISKILDNLINQYYTVAQVPSVLYGQSNVANVSEVSLKLLFNGADNLAKKTRNQMLLGFAKRLEYIGALMGMDFSDIDIAFNFNRPTDNSAVVDDLQKQITMGIMSKETAMKCSPYIVDVQKEVKNLESVDNSSTNLNSYKTVTNI
jgi:SPP1 family phage portal protein